MPTAIAALAHQGSLLAIKNRSSKREVFVLRAISVALNCIPWGHRSKEEDSSDGDMIARQWLSCNPHPLLQVLILATASSLTPSSDLAGGNPRHQWPGQLLGALHDLAEVQPEIQHRRIVHARVGIGAAIGYQHATKPAIRRVTGSGFHAATGDHAGEHQVLDAHALQGVVDLTAVERALGGFADDGFVR